MECTNKINKSYINKYTPLSSVYSLCTTHYSYYTLLSTDIAVLYYSYIPFLSFELIDIAPVHRLGEPLHATYYSCCPIGAGNPCFSPIICVLLHKWNDPSQSRDFCGPVLG